MQARAVDFEELGRLQVWKDLKDILLLRLNSVRDDLESTMDNSMDMYNKGRASELRFLVDLPEYIAKNYDLIKEEDESDGGR
jgi:hypothetical protein